MTSKAEYLKRYLSGGGEDSGGPSAYPSTEAGAKQKKIKKVKKQVVLDANGNEIRVKAKKVR